MNLVFLALYSVGVFATKTSGTADLTVAEYRPFVVAEYRPFAPVTTTPDLTTEYQLSDADREHMKKVQASQIQEQMKFMLEQVETCLNNTQWLGFLTAQIKELSIRIQGGLDRLEDAPLNDVAKRAVPVLVALKAFAASPSPALLEKARAAHKAFNPKLTETRAWIAQSRQDQATAIAASNNDQAMRRDQETRKTQEQAERDFQQINTTIRQAFSGSASSSTDLADPRASTLQTGPTNTLARATGSESTPQPQSTRAPRTASSTCLDGVFCLGGCAWCLCKKTTGLTFKILGRASLAVCRGTISCCRCCGVWLCT